MALRCFALTITEFLCCACFCGTCPPQRQCSHAECVFVVIHAIVLLTCGPYLDVKLTGVSPTLHLWRKPGNAKQVMSRYLSCDKFCADCCICERLSAGPLRGNGEERLLFLTFSDEYGRGHKCMENALISATAENLSLTDAFRKM